MGHRPYCVRPPVSTPWKCSVWIECQIAPSRHHRRTKTFIMAMGRVGPSRGGFGQVWVSGFWPELGSGEGEVLVVQLVPVLPLWTFFFFYSHLYYSLKKKKTLTCTKQQRVVMQRSGSDWIEDTVARRLRQPCRFKEMLEKMQDELQTSKKSKNET